MKIVIATVAATLLLLGASVPAQAAPTIRPLNVIKCCSA
ncbi:MAG: hypothetical protein RLZ88_841 [Actinomycetota bacterium]|jgi:hypothetical protein